MAICHYNVCCIPSNSQPQPALASRETQNHAQSWNTCGCYCCYYLAIILIILMSPPCLVMATSPWCLWSLSRHRAICGLWTPATVGVMSLAQDIGVGAAKFNFRKYPVLFPTFIPSLRLKFTTRLPSSLRTLNPHSVQQKRLLWKNQLCRILFLLINTFCEMRLSIVRDLGWSPMMWISGLGDGARGAAVMRVTGTWRVETPETRGLPGRVWRLLPGEIRDLRLRSLLRQLGSHCEQFITWARHVCEHHNITGRDKMMLTSRGS